MTSHLSTPIRIDYDIQPCPAQVHPECTGVMVKWKNSPDVCWPCHTQTYKPVELLADVKNGDIPRWQVEGNKPVELFMDGYPYKEITRQKMQLLLGILGEAGKPLSTVEIQAKMQLKGINPSQSIIREYLSNLEFGGFVVGTKHRTAPWVFEIARAYQ